MTRVMMSETWFILPSFMIVKTAQFEYIAKPWVPVVTQTGANPLADGKRHSRGVRHPMRAMLEADMQAKPAPRVSV
jgi:hypothetical protein